MNKIFEIASNTPNLVVVKVNADDPLTVAMYPYVNSNMAYISVSKGRDHVLTTILKDGRHGVKFDWGESGHTLISDGLEQLKKEVVKFIEQDSDIPLELTETIRTVELFYNPNFSSWQLSFNGHGGNIWEDKKCLNYNRTKPDNQHGLKWGTEKLQKIIGNSVNIQWEHEIAQTGIDVWKAYVA